MNKFPLFVLGTCCAFLTGAPVAFAQSNAATAPGNSANAADAAWQNLQAVAQHLGAFAPPTSGAAAAAANSQHIADLLSAADQFKAFYTNYPSHASAPEAKRQEALTLVEAWGAGDTTQDTRRQQLVASIRQDKTFSSLQRLQVAGLADNIAVGKQANLSADSRLLNYEQVARSLVKEFPDVSDPYDSLVRIARDGPDAQAKTIATDVLAMPGASDTTKAQAQIILSRQALVGTSILSVAAQVLGQTNVFGSAAGHPVVFYSWATWAPASVAFAKTIAGIVPSGTVVVGLCLDGPDFTAAQSMVAAQNLPGTQLYDPLGVRGKLSGWLDIFDPGRVYVIDGTGTIRSISAQRDLAGALAGLSTP